MRINKILNKFILISVSLIIVIFFAEGILAVCSHFFYPRLIINDNVLGWKCRPTPRKVRRYFGKHAAYDVYINSDGFRDNEFRTDRDYFKIMVLGDSMTFGLEANQEEIFCHLLEDKLKDIYKTEKIDVMNFGITGFSTAQELICLKRYAPLYNPNVFILIMYECNDFEENYTILSSGRFAPHFLLQGDELMFCGTPNPLQKFIIYLRDRSFLFYFLSNISPSLTKRHKLTEEDKVLLMKKILNQMHSYFQEKKAPFFTFYLICDEEGKNKREEIQKFCFEKEIPFKAIEITNSEYVMGDVIGLGHLNRKGHERIAQIVLSELSEKNVFIPLEKKEGGGDFP